MGLLAIYFFTLIIFVCGEGEVVFLLHPESFSFKGDEAVDLSTMKDVLSIAIGFTPEKSSDWSGMRIKSPFNFAEAIVCVAVPGISSIDSKWGYRFPLRTDEPLDVTRSALEWRVTEHFPIAENITLAHFRLDEGMDDMENVLGEMNVDWTAPLSIHLDGNKYEDRAVFDQISLLNAFVDKVRAGSIPKTGLPSVYWITMPALHQLADVYGEDSKTVYEAKQLINEALFQITDASALTFANNVLVAALASDAEHTRRYRRQASKEEIDLNLAQGYSENYPVIFNIFLWFGVAFTMSLIATSIAIATMDPGRDSIIYRMTSNRMKKDN